MKVIRDTPDQLILEETPWLLGIGMVGFILAFVGPGLFLVMSGEWMGLFFAAIGGGLGFMALAVFVERIQLIFDRVAGTLTVPRHDPALQAGNLPPARRDRRGTGKPDRREGAANEARGACPFGGNGPDPAPDHRGLDERGRARPHRGRDCRLAQAVGGKRLTARG